MSACSRAGVCARVWPPAPPPTCCTRQAPSPPAFWPPPSLCCSIFSLGAVVSTMPAAYLGVRAQPLVCAGDSRTRLVPACERPASAHHPDDPAVLSFLQMNVANGLEEVAGVFGPTVQVRAAGCGCICYRRRPPPLPPAAARPPPTLPLSCRAVPDVCRPRWRWGPWPPSRCTCTSSERSYIGKCLFVEGNPASRSGARHFSSHAYPLAGTAR